MVWQRGFSRWLLQEQQVVLDLLALLDTTQYEEVEMRIFCHKCGKDLGDYRSLTYHVNYTGNIIKALCGDCYATECVKHIIDGLEREVRDDQRREVPTDRKEVED